MPARASRHGRGRRHLRPFHALISGLGRGAGGSRPFDAVEALEERRLLSGAPPVGVEDYFAVVAAQQLVVPAPGVLANDSDPEGDPIAATEFSNPTSGIITVLTDDGSFTYDPDPLYLGMSQFTYVPSDGEPGEPVTVWITVYPADDTLPVAEDNSYDVVEDQPLIVGLGDNVLTNDVDVDGDELSATLHRGPQHGELVFNADGTFTYTPDPDFSGVDSFVYVVWSMVGSNLLASPDLGTVTLVVAPVDDPVAVVLPAAQTTPQNTPLALGGASAIRVADPDLSPESIVRVELTATNGLLSLAGPNPGVTIEVGDGTLDPALTIEGELALVNTFLETLSFTPTAGFAGPAGIDVTATVVGEVGEGSTDTGTLAITVTAVVNSGSAQLVENPFNAALMDLVVEGTGTADDIVVVDRRDGSFNVTVNGTFLGKFRPTGKVVVKALGGHDRVTTVSVRGGAIVYGGSGRDTLLGGGGPDLLVGGDGNDMIDGGAGRNLLIGGDGGDVIITRTLGSILVGQATRYDAAASIVGRAALEALLAAWNSEASFHSRVSMVRTQGVTTELGSYARFSSASLIADVDVNTFEHSPVADLLIGIEGDEFNATAADALRLF